MRKITLELDEEQALTLLVVTMLIGGAPDSTRRGHIDEIARQLRYQAGPIDADLFSEFIDEVTDVEKNSIYFIGGLQNPFKDKANA